MSNAVSKPMPKVNAVALRRPRLFPLLVFIAILLFVSLFFVWSRHQYILLEYNISSLEGKCRDLNKELAQLRLEAAKLRNPQRLEKVALERLNLIHPSQQQIIVVD